MKTEKLFTKNFTLMVLGQIISLFGNSILRFTLSLYVLDTTGSAAIFGTILAISMIPTVLLSPFGGILADRVNRRNIMVILDYITSALIISFSFLYKSAQQPMLAVGIVMVLLSIIQSCYQPSVQSSIPVLVADHNLMKANGIVIQVNALANLLGPIIAGFLYSFLNIKSILSISGLCFFFSATMELFLRIPFQKQPRTGNLLHTVKEDLATAFNFLYKENHTLFQLLLVIACINLFLSAMIIVGLPVIVKMFLGLSSQHYGFAEGALGVGTIIGGCLAGIFSSKIQMKTAYKFILISSLALLPIGLALTTRSYPLLSYAVILFFIVIGLSSAAIFNIAAQTFAQQQTPPHLLGKVFSVISVISICALPIGQAIYGGLFQLFFNHISIVILIATIICIIISLITRKIMKKL